MSDDRRVREPFDARVAPQPAAAILTASQRAALERLAAETAAAPYGTVLFNGGAGAPAAAAAERLAAPLRVGVRRIVLDTVARVAIGETEKNLDAVLRSAGSGGAVLLFDEADALFGKRSEIEDSHDRYANVEISWLLSRIEAHRNLAILATNSRISLDDAIRRRLSHVIDCVPS